MHPPAAPTCILLVVEVRERECKEHIGSTARRGDISYLSLSLLVVLLRLLEPPPMLDNNNNKANNRTSVSILSNTINPTQSSN